MTLLEADWKQNRSGLEEDWKQTGSTWKQTGSTWKQTGSRLEADRKQTESGVETNWQRTECLYLQSMECLVSITLVDHCFSTLVAIVRLVVGLYVVDTNS